MLLISEWIGLILHKWALSLILNEYWQGKRSEFRQISKFRVIDFFLSLLFSFYILIQCLLKNVAVYCPLLKWLISSLLSPVESIFVCAFLNYFWEHLCAVGKDADHTVNNELRVLKRAVLMNSRGLCRWSVDKEGSANAVHVKKTNILMMDFCIDIWQVFDVGADHSKQFRIK